MVSLVGAGPGDPDLLTVKALRRIQSAEVLAHDALVPGAILDLAPASCRRVCVGRRCGKGVLPYAVHPEVIHRAREGASVVRLKCGDPMIFGRGGEEAAELERRGIDYEIVPGITAALGAASGAGIPLTERGVASSVTFATGHSVRKGFRDRCNWRALARSGGTLVLYMAGETIGENAARLIQQGCAPDMPAAYIANAARPGQCIVRGPLHDLAARVPAECAGQPAIVIVGEVAAARSADAALPRAACL